MSWKTKLKQRKKMFDLYSYLVAKLAGDQYVKSVYICTGIGRMEELLQNVRDIVMPCAMVDVGVDGVLDVVDGHCLKTYHSFYILESNAQASASDINAILARTKTSGLDLASSMAAESYDHLSPCFGLDASNIGFSAIGPIGAYCYGYGFNLTFIRDHE